MIFSLAVCQSSLPTWSDDCFCVLFNPLSGSTHLFSKWALIVLNMISEGIDSPKVLIDSLLELAADSDQAVEPDFFVELIGELIRYDFLMEVMPA